jgi:peptide/nickel transport system permease protein
MIYTTSYSGYLLDINKWWLIFPASLAITFLCAAFYLVGRALDEVVNPGCAGGDKFLESFLYIER